MNKISVKSFFHFGDVTISNASKKTLYEYVKSLRVNPQKSVGLISQLMYDTCPADFTGREQELNSLNDFVNDNRLLLWWAITGSAGKGKTRLAYEFIKKLNKVNTWIARIINWKSFAAFFTKNDLYINNSKKNIFVVIDYVFSYEKEIAAWLEWLAQNANINKKIRVLLIEREDQKVDPTGQIKYAPWEELFSTATEDLMLIRRLKYAQDNLNLNQFRFSKDSAKEIASSYCKNRNIQISDAKIDSIIIAAQKGSNNTFSPLQILLLTEYYVTAHNSNFSTDIYQLAIRNMVNKELTALRRIFGITADEQDAFDIVLLLATIIGRIGVGSTILDTEIFVDVNLLAKAINKVKNSHMCEKDNNGEYFICGLQPDLVGEFFVYTIFASMNDETIDLILRKISRNHRNELSRFLLRFLEDNRRYILENNKLALFEKYLPEPYMTFIINNDEGESVECEILFTFESETTGKDYIVYTDNTVDNEGNTKVYASIYNPNMDQTKLFPIETEKEWKMVETILEELQQEALGEEMPTDLEESTYITELIKRIQDKSNNDINSSTD